MNSNILEFSRYSDPQVRALVWCLISPGLVKEAAVYPACVTQQWCQKIYDTIQPFLAQLDKEPTPLIKWLDSQKSWRLGVRFEAYWSFIFAQLLKQSELEQYESHIQILTQNVHKGGHKTLGEMDFVYLDKKQQLNHLETAVKFYCLKPDEFGFERLIGPNGSDWLERKLEYLFNKQLLLSAMQQGQAELVNLFYPDKTENTIPVQCRQQGLVKGMIFFPVTGEGNLNDNESRYMNPNYLTGQWGTMDNWYLSDPGEIGRWVMLEKLDWLVPQVYSALEDHLYTAREMAYKLKIHFIQTRRSVLIVHLNYNEEQKLWLELQRVMVVDRYWPTFLRPV
ncbi:MAG: DUF1853 family protein [gamma proteobacterium symbiont of Taylorina sp.]|nr:DUF1853 family protein [gamma proteobacterium symbiont of Taylorina sp.]